MRQRADRVRIRRFLEALGRRLRHPVRFYLVGGAVLIDLGLRAATLDIDYVAVPDDPHADADLEQAIRALKHELDINVEPASPGDFLPVPSWVLDQSPFIGQYGSLFVYYYHLPSLVLGKAARGLEHDFADAEALVRSGVVTWQAVEDIWQAVRSSPTGWLRYEPDEVEQRLAILRRRLDTAAP